MGLLVLLMLFAAGHFGLELLIHLSIKWHAWVMRRVEAEIARYPLPTLRSHRSGASGKRPTLH